jgi:peptidoglycan/LPS O-acetylase OafA/YrhL
MKQTKFDTLLIIRGLLALSVVVWHIGTLNANTSSFVNIPGRTAVWFFFGISGYVIAYGFLTKRYLLNSADIKAFYLNRFLRIYPLFLLLSVLTLVTEYFLHHHWILGFSDIPAQLFMLQFNHVYVLSGVFWTLGIEVQFYLIAPLLASLFLQQLRSIYLVSILIYLVMIAWVPFSFYFLQGSFDGRNLLSNLSHFFIGMISCYFVLDTKKEPVRINNYVLTGIIVLIIAVTNYCFRNRIGLYWTAGSVLIDVAIFSAVLLHTNLKNLQVAPANSVVRILTVLGMISYGVYAWHPYLTEYIHGVGQNVLLAVVVTTLVAFLCYRVIEKPILSMKRKKMTTAV